MALDPRSDEELLACGGEEAFATFYRRHAPSLLGYLMRRTGDAEVAADLTAETFAAALAGSQRFTPTRGSAVNWLYGIAANLLRRFFERGRVERQARDRFGIPRIALDDDALERIEALADVEVIAMELRDALTAMPPEQRAAVHARVVEGLSYEEIASAMTVSHGTARQRVSRGLARLRAAIGGAQ
jgi:RNA polymerase sigma-70 factor (ECF subfamily)